ncbi:30S ribosomal protein S11 [Ruficoccus amylovorans]|uniref:Small ribosomal subunit protein uS11 n=1 Tax=Ruficoccus amylovorans TaxID=1804625 RepID=A0A842HD46_9BACT|nr:30S ribosomal protein S11 [Ruficoccus amylovorans]
MSEEENKKAAAAEEVSQQAEASKPEAAETEAAKVEESKSSQPTAQDLLSEGLGDIKIRKAKGSKNIHSGVCHILATFNNTKVTFSDGAGNVISWSSSGKCNFRGSRKSTAYAAQVVTQDAGRVAMSHGLKEVTVKVKGPGMGRDSAIRALQSLGLNVLTIVDVTPIPHNGCRAPKRRRV